MSLLFKFLDSSIGRKVLMAITGLFLCLFMIVHVSGNMQLFREDYGLAFNQYTAFMTSFMPIKVISYVLYATFLIHIINGLRLVILNRKARPVQYSARKDPKSASWASKNMGLLGVVLLIFLVTHMAYFWYAYKFGDVPWAAYHVDEITGQVIDSPVVLSKEQVPEHSFSVSSINEHGMHIKTIVLKDLYSVVAVAFQETWMVVFYLIGMVALAYHMVHGFQSAFQTMGIRYPIYTPLIRGISVWIFGIIIPLLFAVMPAYFYFLKP